MQHNSFPHLQLQYILSLLLLSASSAPIAVEFLYPNFTASSITFIEKGGIFLTSNSSSFSAIFSSSSPQSSFIFSILHSPTNTLIWSANRAAPAPYTALLSLSPSGLSIALPNGTSLWSTPLLSHQVSSLHLLDSGNILLLDHSNSSLWQSFEHPTDTLVSSQRLPVGSFLSTLGDEYRLLVTLDDAVLRWMGGGQNYWRLSNDPVSVKELNDPVSYLAVNESGLFLFSEGGRVVYVVGQLNLGKIQFIKLEEGGKMRVLGYSGNGSVLSEEFVAPIGGCDLPLCCGELGLCGVDSRGVNCNCLLSFRAVSGGRCLPENSSGLASVSDCENRENKLEDSYFSLGDQVNYFGNKFASPETAGGNLSSCRELCSSNCFCLGFFYANSSKLCFLIKNRIGSLISRSNQGVNDNGEGFIKIQSLPQSRDNNSAKSSKLFQILLPSVGAIVLFVVIVSTGLYYLHRHHQNQSGNKQSPQKATISHTFTDKTIISDESETSDEICIPGLPHRFTYAELVTATNNFSTKIGSGGFGEVFLGKLPSDNTTVAVKRIKTGSNQIKNEFLTEIAVIGSIHHINLVRLRGYSAEGSRRRLLVYEHMNRGSLDRSLFRRTGPVLEWQERMKIAIGAAKGIAYLHTGCERKIIHCDIKPENILLSENGGVKISDFGLVKLLSPEESALFTTMRGTRGYLAPEWLANSGITDRVDVYSYGMVLLEIIRGRKNWGEESGEGERRDFDELGREGKGKGGFLGIVDGRMEGRVREEEVERAVKVALCCLNELPEKRPEMGMVVGMLEGSVEVGKVRREAFEFLRLICGEEIEGV